MVADTGPDQLGAARLVQLAALVVLHRRALARGSELRIGMTGEPADRWHDGDLASQFEAWLGARHHDVPGREHIDERLASLDAGDELWLLAGEALGAACADLNQVVVSREQGWNGDGTATVEIALDGNRDLLPVPSPPLSVKTLRGRELRRRRVTGSATATGSLSCPAFGSNDRRLVMRGETSRELVVVTIPTQPGGGGGRARTHRFQGDVLAAASLGRRLVALVRTGDEVRCVVVGKRLGRLAEIVIDVNELRLPPDDELSATLSPVFFDSGNVVFRCGDDWTEIAVGGMVARHAALCAVAPGRNLDQPRRIWLDDAGWTLRDWMGNKIPEVDLGALGLVTGTEAYAFVTGDDPWRVLETSRQPTEIEVASPARVIGLVRVGGEPSLISVSDGGMLVRRHTRDQTSTLTRWSGVALAHAVHPLLSLIAVQRSEQRMEVGDINTGELLTVVEA